MKGLKNKSSASETRLSNSHVLNASSLQQSIDPKDQYFSHQFQKTQRRQLQFLRHKNIQLQERIKRMDEEIKQLQANKKQLLTLNQEYVGIVNRYYENCNKKCELSSLSPEGKVLQSLQRDHRNLVRHVNTMEKQIKNYIREMEKFNELKIQLRQANHTSVKELFDEVLDLASQNMELKKKNNKFGYEIEKSKMEFQGIKKAHKQKQLQAGNSEEKIAKMRCLLNSVQQQSTDKSNAYEQRIYQLEVKVQKLQKQLRKQQQIAAKSTTTKRLLQMKQVQHVHQYQKLQKNLNNLLNPRSRSVKNKSSLERTKSQMLMKGPMPKKNII